ncbi:MAG: branched-chain amino acid ABC transporter permease [Thermodesulfobacteria bacterium]|nr:branched-chain amino acid ABC transporter permease [Thermodesulfobacteriota bacterium]
MDAVFWQFLLSGLSSGAIYALIALGFGVVENSTGIVNFAQGDFLVLGAFVAYSLLVSWHVPYFLAFPLVILVTALVGLLLERLVLSRARCREILILVFITVGASIFLRGVIKEIWGKRPLSLPPLFGEEPLRFLGVVIDPQNVGILAVALAAFFCLHLFFRYTLWGKAMRAVAADRETAALMGIPVPLVVALSFALAGALGGLAGILVAPVTPLSFDSGVVIGLKGFAAAVLGGYGHFGGALLGGLLLGLLESLSAYWISSAYKNVLAFGVLVLVLLVRPEGLLGKRQGERP